MIIGEASTYLCAKRVGVRGHAPLGNFDFGPFIKYNLVESLLHKHNSPFIVSLKLL